MSSEAPSGSANFNLRSSTNSADEWQLYLSGEDLRFWEIGATDRVTFQKGGNVGIGTTGPGAKLQVNINEANTNRVPYINLWNDAAGYAKWSIDKSTDNDLTFSTYEGNSPYSLYSNPLTLTFTGNVGIGTTAPGYKLDVSGTLGVTGVTTFSSNIDVQGTLYTRGNLSVLNKAGDNWLTWATRDISGSESVYNLSNIGTLTTSGNVGIGTTSPGVKLDVAGSIQSRVQSSGDSSGIALIATAETPSIVFNASDDSDRWTIASILTGSQNTDKLIFKGGSGPNSILTLVGAGEVGIGTTSPSHKLDVVGTAGLSTGTLWTNTSDSRVKTNIQTIPNALTVISQLNPVQFKYTSDYLSGHPEIQNVDQFGFVAQEYQTVFPNSVSTGSNGYLQMNASNVIPYAIRAIQELSQSTDGQTIEMEMTNNRLLSLESTIELNAQGQVVLVNDTIVAESDPTTIIFDRQEVVDLNKRLSTVEAILATKADISEVEDLRTRITTLEGMAMTASMSANLDSIADGDFTVLGKTNVNDLGVTGTITAGLLTINGFDDGFATPSATISTLSGPLRLQHLASAPVEIMGGKVTIDEKGNILVSEGDLVVSKGKIIAPEIQTDKLTITTPAIATESASITATSSAVLATSNVAVAASIGKVVIPAGNTVVAVKTSALTPHSQIFISSDLPIPMGRKQTSADTFEITIKEPLNTELEVDWWIVN